MIVTRAPGKLYIAGEYAVIEPGHPAILVAVDQFITVSLKEDLDQGSITSYGDMPILWTRDRGKLVLDKRDNRLFYIMAGINIVETYAKEMGRKLGFYHLDVVSELESDKGKKYGLGSSAAVTVATIEALCIYYKIPLRDEELFKLSALAHMEVNNNGSCGDVAASVYGGWISFRTFDKAWLLDQWKNNSLRDLLNMEWKDLSIESLTPPEELELAIGWTGLPASTSNLVDNVNDKRIQNDLLYKRFLDNSRKCVEKMILAFKEKNIEEIQKQIKVNRGLLVNIGKDLGIVIETPLLKDLCNSALRFNAYGKSSGAGGGDCGILILKGHSDLKAIIDEWKELGIVYLPLKVYKKKGDNIDC